MIPVHVEVTLTVIYNNQCGNAVFRYFSFLCFEGQPVQVSRRSIVKDTYYITKKKAARLISTAARPDDARDNDNVRQPRNCSVVAYHVADRCTFAYVCLVEFFSFS